MRKQLKAVLIILFSVVLLAGPELSSPAIAGENATSSGFQTKAQKLISSNNKLKKAIKSKEKQISKIKDYLDKHKDSQTSSNQTNSSTNSTTTDLANLNYAGTQEITVNNNNPQFSDSDLSTSSGAWQTFGELDNLNRVSAANVMLNVSLMPHAKREPLYVDPTGWHNKKGPSGWLYNRSHLIGYQFTGQNNNVRNLMTGTASLNSPEMQHHEMDIAYYLKRSANHYVRYRVTPVFRGNELLARGVQMEAQSVGDNSIHFNVYIFNVEKGFVLNYNDGTSTVG